MCSLIASDVLSDQFSQGEPFQKKNKLIAFMVRNMAGWYIVINDDNPCETASGGIIKQ